jgi:hypothetical protein
LNGGASTRAWRKEREMPKLTGTHRHRPTGRVMQIEWEYENRGSRADWKYRLRYAGKELESKDGYVVFDPAMTNAVTAAIDCIRRVLDEREALYKIG